MRSLLVSAIKLELCFTRSHTVYILSVFTYAGSVRDQERVSGRHTSMCVQSSVSTKAVTQRCCHTHRAELLWLLNLRSQKHKNAHWTAFYRILFTRFQLLRFLKFLTLRCSKIHLPRRWLSLRSFPKIINVVRDYGGGSGQCVHFRCFYISFNLKVLIQKSWKSMRCRGKVDTHKNILPVDFEAEPRTGSPFRSEWPFFWNDRWVSAVIFSKVKSQNKKHNIDLKEFRSKFTMS